jgi:hypothetical protein
VAGQAAVGETQADDFFRAECAVVQAAEERGQIWPDPGYGGEQGLDLPGLATTLGLMAMATFGTCQLTWSPGLESSSPASTA